MSINSKRITAALATATVVVAGGFGLAQQASGQSTPAKAKSTVKKDHRGHKGHKGPRVAALAAKLGVSTTVLKAALDATRPARPDAASRPTKAQKQTERATFLATELGVSVDQAKAALEAARPAKPVGDRPENGQKGPRGPRPDVSVLAGKIATSLGIDKDVVTAALIKGRAAHEAERNAKHSARQSERASALAQKLDIDVSTVKAALESLRPAMPQGGPTG